MGFSDRVAHQHPWLRRLAATEEWYKIGRDQLVPHDGYYDLRITAELWEIYYYDYLALMAVDHPAGTEIFVDERFVIPPAKLAITTVATPHPIARADRRQRTTMSPTCSARSMARLWTSFGRGQYQGVTRDHYVEIDLGDDVSDQWAAVSDRARLDARHGLVYQCRNEPGTSLACAWLEP